MKRIFLIAATLALLTLPLFSQQVNPIIRATPKCASGEIWIFNPDGSVGCTTPGGGAAISFLFRDDIAGDSEPAANPLEIGIFTDGFPSHTEPRLIAPVNGSADTAWRVVFDIGQAREGAGYACTPLVSRYAPFYREDSGNGDHWRRCRHALLLRWQ